ncbi:fasciclin domain-containing protein [Pontimicrobium aquaticum]|uniref:Fasciclin domain-containing protein n=1 Tax=Pontimicrobium aquaticum TaxID=2565367 RepID=A0A4U0EPB2_9FLAO|nr:fasciclin domain-containing protein [Pontimicrobium aquaticum]TJY33473.1 fasciclin domain-containing protein [Pontimicrobium aquaticum]
MKKKNLFKTIALSFALLVGANVMAQDKNIVETAIASSDHTTLVAAVKAADLVDVLSSEGPFTVFAPTNAAFDKLPEGTVTTLLKAENKSTLQGVLTYHVVSGKFEAKDVIALIKKGNGKAVIPTVNGGKLTAMIMDDSVYITDENGNKAKVTTADLDQTNGVIHVIDSVVLPK